MKSLIIVLCGITVSSNSFSQDTIQIDNRVQYYSHTDSMNILSKAAKNIYYRATYSRELILQNPDSSKLEHCFYYDGKRYCHPSATYSFKKEHDSKIKVYYNQFEEEWDFIKVNDTLFHLQQESNGLIESGYAKSLFPLDKIGEFCTLNKNGDTLWTTVYTDIVFPELILPEKKLKDTIYVICEKMPEYETGQDNLHKDIIANLNIKMPVLESSVHCSTTVVSFVIDKKGRMQNIKMERSCGNGFIDRAILTSLVNLEDFTCGYRGRRPVNALLTIPIHIDFQ